MEKFTLINKARSRIKVFEPFDDSSKNSSMFNAILISYGCFHTQSSKPIMINHMIELNEKSRKDHKNLLADDAKK